MLPVNSRYLYLHVVLFLIFVFLSGRVLILGVADFNLKSALSGDRSALKVLLSWQPEHARGVYLQALDMQEMQPDKASKLLFRALYENPADVRPLALLASIDGRPGRVSEADNMMLLASRNMPANKALHLRAADYWVKRQQLERALQSWSLALSINKGLGKQLYPVFVRVLENDSVRVLLAPFALQPPLWWDDFIVHVALKTSGVSIIESLLSLRSKSNVSLSSTERFFLVKRNLKDGRWRQAYLIWAEGLSISQRSNLASVYDGSFELGDEAELFGWRIRSSRTTETSIRRTVGAHGLSAVRVKFDNQELRYRNLSQYILLPSGEYTFKADKRTHKLSGRGRLKWFIRCADEETSVIGESRALIPSREWERAQFDFTVPGTCGAQLLRLETIGKHAFDHKLSGTLWMDNIRITKKQRAPR